MRIELKELGLKQAMNMKEETIIKKYKELTEGAEPIVSAKKSIEVVVTKEDKAFLESVEFDGEWLASIANQYDFNRFVYVHKFKAFRCYQNNNQLDWVSINDLSLINLKKEITHTLLKHQPLQKDKQVIKLPWRN